MFKYSLIFSFFISTSFAQTFYVTVPIDFPVGNKAFELNTSTCDSFGIFFCLPTHDTAQYFENQFSDLAIDKNQNIYYVSGWGSLYKRNLNDTTSCQFLGTFNTSINALLADSQDVIYAAGQVNGVCKLFT